LASLNHFTLPVSRVAICSYSLFIIDRAFRRKASERQPAHAVP
jgi:hypothetical protein